MFCGGSGGNVSGILGEGRKNSQMVRFRAQLRSAQSGFLRISVTIDKDGALHNVPSIQYICPAGAERLSIESGR
jgi:hypothetical protein